MTKATKRQLNGHHPPTAASNDSYIPFDQAVAEYQELDKNQCRDQMRQGELATRLSQNTATAR